MSLFDLVSFGYPRLGYYFDDRSREHDQLYNELVRLVTPPPKPQPKTWRAIVDVFGYGEQDISVTKEGKNIIVKGCHERPHSVEGDYDRREMRHTVAVPEAVPVDDCSMHTLVRGGRLLIELKEKLPEPAPPRAVPVETQAAGDAVMEEEKSEGVVEEKSEGVVTKPGEMDLIPALATCWDSKEGSYEMGCSLPGFSKDCVTVNVDEGSKTVTVKAEERDDDSMRSFQKTVSLPKDAKAESLKSVFSDDGQLMITAEKLAED